MFRFLLIICSLLVHSVNGVQLSHAAEGAGWHSTESGAVPAAPDVLTSSQSTRGHAELTVSAASVPKGEGLNDSSLSALDDSKKHINSDPLSIMEQPRMPIDRHKTTEETWRQLLERPYGPCSEGSGCKAPYIEAYPGTAHTGNSRQSEERYSVELAKQGAEIYTEKCQSCHEFSEISGYDAVALSAFSSDWIYQYTHSPGLGNDTDQMPKTPVSSSEATALFNFFQASRARREGEVDTLVARVLTNFTNQNTMISDRSIQYIWNDFWQEAACTQCHESGKRGGEVFDVSPSGIVAWLKDDRPEELVERLLIRHVEKRLGLGSSTPGMPMTMEPVPLAGITLLSTWIDNGCPDTEGKKYCVDP